MSLNSLIVSTVMFVHNLNLPEELKDEVVSAEANLLDEFVRILSNANLTDWLPFFVIISSP